jgi:hypothetical protein
MAPVTLQSGLPMLKSLDMAKLLNASSVSWDETHETMIFFWTDAHPNTSLNLRHSKTAQTLPWKLRDTWTGLAAERPIRDVKFKLRGSSKHGEGQGRMIQRWTVRDCAAWQWKLRKWQNFCQMIICIHLLYLFQCLTGHFLAIQAVRLLRTLRINRTRVNLVRLSRETCGNSCQVVRTFVDSGPFCQHSASILPAFSAWSFWHFGPVAISCWEGTPKLQCLIDPDRLSESLKHLQYPSVL